MAHELVHLQLLVHILVHQLRHLHYTLLAFGEKNRVNSGSLLTCYQEMQIKVIQKIQPLNCLHPQSRSTSSAPHKDFQDVDPSAPSLSLSENVSTRSSHVLKT